MTSRMLPATEEASLLMVGFKYASYHWILCLESPSPDTVSWYTGTIDAYFQKVNASIVRLQPETFNTNDDTQFGPTVNSPQLGVGKSCAFRASRIWMGVSTLDVSRSWRALQERTSPKSKDFLASHPCSMSFFSSSLPRKTANLRDTESLYVLNSCSAHSWYH